MPNPIYADLPVTVFAEMSALAAEHNALNLGQGFPDEPGPEAIRAHAAEAVLHGDNQYPPTLGLPALRQAVAAHYARAQGLDFDWASEVTVTSGATEALAACFLGLIAPGDEVVMFQPLYDSYLPVVRRAGGVPVLGRLEPPRWRWDRAMLERLFTPKTRLVLLNNPLNPSAVITCDEDLALLAEFVVRHDAVVVCDEVWEHVVTGGAAFRPLISFPGMRERCVKIGSAGKMFALTGWKVGFVCADPLLSALVRKAHQFLTFTTAPNLQSAVAWGLENSADWFAAMPGDLTRQRDRLAAALRAEGFAVLPSEGTYFLNVDLAASGVTEDDRSFCLRAVKEAGVAAIPLSAFYDENPITSVIRLCFAKRDAVLDEGARRLARARASSRAASGDK